MQRKLLPNPEMEKSKLKIQKSKDIKICKNFLRFQKPWLNQHLIKVKISLSIFSGFVIKLTFSPDGPRNLGHFNKITHGKNTGKLPFLK